MTVADPGEGPGGPGTPLFSDQTMARRAEKKHFGDRFPPPPLTQGLDDRLPPPSPLSQGLDPVLMIEHDRT